MDAKHKDISQAAVVPGLVRTARTLLGWTQRDLAAAAGLSLMAVSRFEQTGEGSPPAVEAIHGALQGIGVHLFGDDTGHGLWQGMPAETGGTDPFTQNQMSRRPRGPRAIGLSDDV